MSTGSAVDEHHPAAVVPALHYHAASLWREDVELLREGQWLNDNVLTFWAEFLAHDVFEGRDHLSFLHPSAAFMGAFLGPEDMRDTFRSLDLGRKRLVFIPVNDSDAPERVGGGSHWSLLVWVRGEARFRHFDSSAGHNRKAAEALARAFFPLVGGPAAGTACAVLHDKTPQQRNGHDCGAYTMAIAAAIGTNEGPCDLGLVTPASVTAWRARLHSIATDLATMAKLDAAVAARWSGGGEHQGRDI